MYTLCSCDPTSLFILVTPPCLALVLSSFPCNCAHQVLVYFPPFILCCFPLVFAGSSCSIETVTNLLLYFPVLPCHVYPYCSFALEFISSGFVPQLSCLFYLYFLCLSVLFLVFNCSDLIFVLFFISLYSDISFFCFAPLFYCIFFPFYYIFLVLLSSVVLCVPSSPALPAWDSLPVGSPRQSANQS